MKKVLLARQDEASMKACEDAISGSHKKHIENSEKERLTYAKWLLISSLVTVFSLLAAAASENPWNVLSLLGLFGVFWFGYLYLIVREGIGREKGYLDCLEREKVSQTRAIAEEAEWLLKTAKGYVYNTDNKEDANLRVTLISAISSFEKKNS